MMLKNDPEEDELKVKIGEEDSELIERLKEIIKKNTEFIDIDRGCPVSKLCQK